jgi:hypothetical protein
MHHLNHVIYKLQRDVLLRAHGLAYSDAYSDTVLRGLLASWASLLASCFLWLGLPVLVPVLLCVSPISLVITIYRNYLPEQSAFSVF